MSGTSTFWNVMFYFAVVVIVMFPPANIAVGVVLIEPTVALAPEMVTAPPRVRIVSPVFITKAPAPDASESAVIVSAPRFVIASDNVSSARLLIVILLVAWSWMLEVRASA